MKITIFGSGYVGLVTGACLAEVGNSVLCVDIDEGKVKALRAGVLPIYEPDLESLLTRNVEAGRLRFTTDGHEGVQFGEIQMIAVGTPPNEDGSADTQYVWNVAHSIGQMMTENKVIVMKSTVPVGTCDAIEQIIEDELTKRGQFIDFTVVSNPEFLKEGAAVKDFMRPDRIIIGTEDEHAHLLMRTLYAPFQRNHDRIMRMDVRSAELTKYASNAMLATRISFMNELALIAEHVGADIKQVRQGMGADPRIGYHFLYAGCGYGGSCFPKDVKALCRTAREAGAELHLIPAIETVNARQKLRLMEKVIRRFGSNLTNKRFAVWGLAFKPETNDMREAPSCVLIEALWQHGAEVIAYDPAAAEEAMHLFKKRLPVAFSPIDALTDVDALIIVTEWPVFRSPDFEQMKQRMRNKVIFDGRNLYDSEIMLYHQFEYYPIGCKTVLPQAAFEQPQVSHENEDLGAQKIT